MPNTVAAMPATVTINVGSSNWVEKANRAINQKKRINLKLVGYDAFNLGEALRRFNRSTRASFVEPTTAVVITSAIVIGVIAVVGLGVLATICLYGISRSYTIKATHKVKGPLPFDDQLTLDLVPPRA